MRINVYAQEITDEVEVVGKWGTNYQGEQEQFFGLRFFLVSPKELHHSEDDDDRSAVTFWLPKSQDLREQFVSTLYTGCKLVEDEVIEADQDDDDDA